MLSIGSARCRTRRKTKHDLRYVASRSQNSTAPGLSGGSTLSTLQNSKHARHGRVCTLRLSVTPTLTRKWPYKRSERPAMLLPNLCCHSFHQRTSLRCIVCASSPGITCTYHARDIIAVLTDIDGCT